MSRIDFQTGTWLNAPPSWRMPTPDSLELTTGEKKDFWQETFYGFRRDSGHFLSFPCPSSATVTLRVQGRFRELYDQAGLMLRVDERQWVKAGVEFTDGKCFLSVVVTDKFSDWSLSQSFQALEDFYLRFTFDNGALRVQASLDGTQWFLLRLAPFAPRGPLTVGPMACTPQRSGLNVTFSDFQISPAMTTDLHSCD